MDWRYNTIWFEQLNQDEVFQMDFKEKNIISDNKSFENSEYAIIWHLKSKINSFDNLAVSDNLLHLELNSSNIKDFSGIQKFKNIKRLELHYCLKLENDNALSLVNDTLEFLNIDQSKKFYFTEELLQLKKLKVLCLNDCESIANLDFLSNLPNLIEFRFVNTNILDGNLKPILEHPNLRTVSFLNKRHYNFKSIEIQQMLNGKYRDDYKVFAYKDEGYSTYRYNYES